MTWLFGGGDSALFRSYEILYYPSAFFDRKERFVKYSSGGMQSNFCTNVPLIARPLDRVCWFEPGGTAVNR